MYYKQKLQVHNFTICELNNPNYIIIDYIETFKTNIQKYEEIVLISDGCDYQNRNKTLSSTLSNVAKSLSITILHLYLTKDHTMMEADRVHSTLERLFNLPINSPSDYIALMRKSCVKNPYSIKVLDYTFFKNYDNIFTLTSIRPGTKKGDKVVSDIVYLNM